MSSLASRACLGLLALWPCRLAAQGPATVPSFDIWHVDRFTAEDGLAENNLRSVVQDSAGFIWVLSRSGVLQRFDGHAFVDLRDLVPAADLPLARNVRAALVDTRRALWIVAHRTLFRLDAAHQPHRRISTTYSVSVAATDSLGNLWFIDGDSLKAIETTTADPRPRAVARVAGGSHFLAAGHSGFVWHVRVDGGTVVDRVHAETGETQSWRLPDIGLPLGITEDFLGRVWISGDHGVAVRERHGPRFRPLPEFSGMRTVALTAAEQGTLFAVTDEWVARIDSSGRIVDYHVSPQAFGRSALPNSAVADDEQGLWVASVTAGLLRLQVREPAFTLFSNTGSPWFPLTSNFITALHESRNGSLWVGTMPGGAYRLDAGGRRVTRLPVSSSSKQAQEYDAWRFEEDNDGNLWMGTSRGVCRFDRHAFHCESIAGGAWDIARTPDGWFWLASNLAGVTSIDPRTMRRGDAIPAHPAHLATAVYADGDSGDLWIGMGDRVLRARVRDGAVTAPPIDVSAPLRENDVVYQFYRDRDGGLYAGTGAGLLVFLPDSGAGRFEPAPTTGLPMTTIFSIVSDTSGRLWLGSAHGLVQYAPASGLARRYGKRDNFLSGELNRRAAIVRRNGSLLFGGVEGMTQFDPDVVAASRPTRGVALTRWRRMTEQGVQALPIPGSRRLKLERQDRSFTIEFAAMSYAPRPGRRYRYRLDGLNESWIETIDNSATFATPPPGRYVFQVQSASGGDESWSLPGGSLTIEVAPPIWSTTWFRLSLIVLTALLGWMAHRWRVRQAVITERLRLRISRDLHDEIGAGLSSIALLSDVAGTTTAERAQLQRIGESARTMVADLRDIVWAIDPEADRGRDVESRMRDVAASLLRDITVTFDLRTDGSGHIDMATRRDLLRLYKEILHNVARHSRATEAHIRLRVQHGAIELTVSDNGIGFVPDESHTGTGLKSVRERAARLGGDVTFASEPGKGTTARFVRRGTRTRRTGGDSSA